MDFSIKFDTVKSGWSIVYIEGSQVIISKKSIVFLSMGGQWLSGRVLDSRQKGPGFEPHQRHCVVSLSKTH